MATYESLVEQAQTQTMVGWDFSYLQGRRTIASLPWDYAKAVKQAFSQCHALLDIGTGGGELLASLAPLPERTCATEGYAPNIPVAQDRLEPLRVSVHAVVSDSALPFEDHTFDVVINCHASFSETEVFRVLKPGGQFITQQIGSLNNVALNDYFGAPAMPEWTLYSAVDQLSQAGFSIDEGLEAYPRNRFYDIGAIVFYLQIINWQVPDFTVKKYDTELRMIHEEIRREGYFQTVGHQFFISAKKPTNV